MQVFSDLIRALQKAQAELVLSIEEKQRKTESLANAQIEELKSEIDVLKMRNTELEYLAHTEDHIHFLQVRDHHIHEISLHWVNLTLLWEHVLVPFYFGRSPRNIVTMSSGKRCEVMLLAMWWYTGLQIT